MYLGIDIGSAATKAALLNEAGELVAHQVRQVGIGGGQAEIVKELTLQEAGVSASEVKYIVATGYGRIGYQEADKQIAELSCHAKGVVHCMDGIRTIIDIGGQDAKVILLDPKGSILNFVMNDKCAAGTGRFLEVMARVLGCEIGDLAEMDEKAEHAAEISSTCTVFAESEVISRLASGESRENVVRGVHVSVARRIVGLVGRVGLLPKVAMTGGVAYNKGVRQEIAKALDQEVLVPENPQLMGAYGAAIFAREAAQK